MCIHDNKYSRMKRYLIPVKKDVFNILIDLDTKVDTKIL